MKALKVLGVIFGLLGVLVAVGYFGWLNPPSADDVCGNVSKIVKDKLGTVPKPVDEECHQSATKAPEFGRAVWVKRLKCRRDASSWDTLKACDDIKSL
jgi:hypothetical protein